MNNNNNNNKREEEEKEEGGGKVKKKRMRWIIIIIIIIIIIKGKKKKKKLEVGLLRNTVRIKKKWIRNKKNQRQNVVKFCEWILFEIHWWRIIQHYPV